MRIVFPGKLLKAFRETGGFVEAFSTKHNVGGESMLPTYAMERIAI
jgi:hypothetical protein